MHKTILAALGSLLILAACGGGGSNPPMAGAPPDDPPPADQPEPDPEPDPEPEPPDDDDDFRDESAISVGYPSYRPANVATYTLQASLRGIDSYVGQRTFDDGAWTDWYADITDVADASFGMTIAPDGRIYPWAIGPMPDRGLSANQTLAGTVSWAGGLGGIGLDGILVAGLADMTIELETLSGQLAFTEMQYWSSLAEFSVETGTQWGGGELEYDIAVSGNFFRDTGGDEGAVIGAFFGPGHEGMGGRLTRDDLVGAFGGSR